jgi:hypothetical protein
LRAWCRPCAIIWWQPSTWCPQPTASACEPAHSSLPTMPQHVFASPGLCSSFIQQQKSARRGQPSLSSSPTRRSLQGGLMPTHIQRLKEEHLATVDIAPSTQSMDKFDHLYGVFRTAAGKVLLLSFSLKVAWPGLGSWRWRWGQAQTRASGHAGPAAALPGSLLSCGPCCHCTAGKLPWCRCGAWMSSSLLPTSSPLHW